MSEIYPWHKTTWDKFIHARSQNHLPHAILLAGDRGIGKLHLASAMVKSLLCMSSQDKTNSYLGCNNCQACKTYNSGANPDYLHIELLEGKQQISVDQIRELSNFITFTSSFNSHRVILLNPVERMNRNAANSLLKALEEPAKNTVLILVTSHLSQIIATIKSRCQLLSVPMPSKKESLDWLNEQVPDHPNPELALEIVNGKPLQAIDINDEMIKSREELESDILDVLTKNRPITEIAKKWEKFDLTLMLNWQILWIQAFIKNEHSLSSIQKKIKGKISIKRQWQLYQQLISQKQLVHTSVNSLIFIENMLISWAQVKSE